MNVALQTLSTLYKPYKIHNLAFKTHPQKKKNPIQNIWSHLSAGVTALVTIKSSHNMLSLISPILVDISYCSHTSKCAIAFSNAESVLDSVHVTVCTQRKHLRMYGSQCAADSKKKKKS